MYHFIINPNSRTGKGIEIWHKLIPVLERGQIPYQSYLTRQMSDATRIARGITSDERNHTIVIVGGDGTVNEVMQGIQYPEKIALGYIPTGSSNDFARGFSIPTNPFRALDIILNPRKFTQMDIGILHYGKRIKRFCVSAGIGFDASICHEALHSKLKTVLNMLGMGKLTYALLAIKQLALYEPGNIIVTFNDREIKTYQNVYFASVMNHRYEGGGLKMSPEADPSDGELDVCIVEKYPKLVLLCLLPTAFFGWHTRFRHVHIRRCHAVSIVRSEAAHVHTDGESCQMQKAIDAFCLPEKIKVITG